MLQGEWVFVPDEIECYVPGKVLKSDGSGTLVETESGQVRSLLAAKGYELRIGYDDGHSIYDFSQRAHLEVSLRRF